MRIEKIETIVQSKISSRNLIPVIVAIILLAGVFSMDRLNAGNYHSSSSSSILCADCHTMHFSMTDPDKPGSWGAGPYYPQLLTQSSINGLCLSCHDTGTGANDTAPDVMQATSYGEERGAGRFEPEASNPNDNGHDIGGTDVAPGGAWSNASGITCADCHEPHGNANYRNLKPRPTGLGADFNVTQVTEAAFNPTSAQYYPGNISYTGSQFGLSRWCRTCHTDFHCDDAAGATCSPATSVEQKGSASGDTVGAGGDQWIRHPTRDVTMAEACANSHVDDADGSCNDASKGRWFVSAAPRSWLPIVSATSTIPGTEGASDNEVFCGTCHKAHGSVNPSALIYDTITTNALEDDPGGCTTVTCLCQNCHYK